MARGSLIRRFARWHIWLGWLAAIPLLLWTASGLFMTLRPIDEVRGGALRQPPTLIQTEGLQLPKLAGYVKRLALVDAPGGAVWVVTDANGKMTRYGASGLAAAPVAEAEARKMAVLAYRGDAKLEAIQRFDADHAPLDLRQTRPSWQAKFTDDTHVYIDADTGEVLALRTGWWRAYDFMWGLHIMDPVGRENTSHVLLWLFGAVALVMSLLGTVLLFRRRRAVRAA